MAFGCAARDSLPGGSKVQLEQCRSCHLNRKAGVYAGPKILGGTSFSRRQDPMWNGRISSSRVVRGHDHMSMVLLAMLFMLEQRLQHHQDIPLLSCADVTTLLKSTLPKRDISEEEVLRQLEVRHKKRQD